MFGADGESTQQGASTGTDREAFLEQTHMPLGTGYPGTVTLGLGDGLEYAVHLGPHPVGAESRQSV